MEGCCGHTLKIGGGLLNFILAIFGLLSLGLGIFLFFVYLDGNSALQWSLLFDGNPFFSPTGLWAVTATLSVAALLIILGGLGCCSVLTENKCLSYTSGILGFVFGALVIVLAITVALVMPFAVKSGLQSSIKQYTVDDSNVTQYPQAEYPVSKYSSNYVSKDNSGLQTVIATQDQEVSRLWDELQIENKCCGVEDFSDWQATKAFPDSQGNVVPKSCCSRASDVNLCLKNPEQNLQFVGTGCAEKVVKKLQPVNWALSSLAVLMVVYLLLMCIFGQCIKSSSKSAASRGYETIENGD